MMESFHGPINQRIFEAENNILDYAEENMPFLKMLQVEDNDNEIPSSVFSTFVEPIGSFQLLLKLQHQKRPWQWHYSNSNQTTSYNVVEAAATVSTAQAPALEPGNFVSPRTSNKRKRKRARLAKNKEEMESHRMTHIAVERNRRRQMNDHLTQLRSLMPPSYTQRGDQASIVGGAIDFIKELEQVLHSLQDERRLRTMSSSLSSCSSPSPYSSEYGDDENCGAGGFMTAESKSSVANVKVRMIQSHVSMKIESYCGKKTRQLMKVVLGLEEMRLTVLQLNVNSSSETSSSSLYYSFSLRIEEDCRLRSAMEIAEAVHHMFRLINAS